MTGLRSIVPLAISRLALVAALPLLSCASSGSGGGGATAAEGAEAAPIELSSPEPAAAEETAAVAAAASPADAFLGDEAAVKRGNQLFRAVCSGYCHSTEEAKRKAPDLFDCRWDHGGGDAEIFDAIVQGIPETQMQGFGGKLPDEDLWKIVAYIRSSSSCG